MKLFLTRNILVENFQTTPSKQIDEIDEMEKSLPKNINSEIKIPTDVLNSFQIKPKLNPELWVNDKLDPMVIEALNKIANDFITDLELPSKVKIKDIVFTGSLANFNWSKFSDVDLHIIIDFSDLNANEELIKGFFDANKNLWNLNHNIKIKNFPIELYVQDIREKLNATAVYSVKHNKWILKPSKEDFKVNKNVIKKKAESFFSKLKEIKKNYDKGQYDKVISKADTLKKTIKNYRQSGLESGGELSVENLVFKVLRRTPYIEILNNYKSKAYDEKMSLDEIKNGL